MDRRWYKTMACSHYNGEKWVYEGSAKERHTTLREKVTASLGELRQVAFEGVQIFNQYAPSASHITLLVLEHPPHYELRGIMLLRYDSQVKLQRQDPYMVMSLHRCASFKQRTLAQSKFFAKEDDLGGVLWCSMNNGVWNEEQLVKCALKELVKHGVSPAA